MKKENEYYECVVCGGRDVDDIEGLTPIHALCTEHDELGTNDNLALVEVLNPDDKLSPSNAERTGRVLIVSAEVFGAMTGDDMTGRPWVYVDEMLMSRLLEVLESGGDTDPRQIIH